MDNRKAHPLTGVGLDSESMAEGVGFEPTVGGKPDSGLANLFGSFQPVFWRLARHISPAFEPFSLSTRLTASTRSAVKTAVTDRLRNVVILPDVPRFPQPAQLCRAYRAIAARRLSHTYHGEPVARGRSKRCVATGFYRTPHTLSVRLHAPTDVWWGAPCKLGQWMC